MKKAPVKKKPIAKSKAKVVAQPKSKPKAAAAQPALALGAAPLRRVRTRTALAEQFASGKPAASPRPTVEPVKKKRRTAADKSRRQELMAPSNDLIARLSRAGAISTAAPEAAPAPREQAEKTARRSRKWQSTCGRCGATTTFTTPAGICPQCGAIAMRD